MAGVSQEWRPRKLPVAVQEQGMAEIRSPGLRHAALGVGMDGDKMGSHSLRIGGASALYHATGEIETVKRYGRWSSGAFHKYLWDSAEQAKGVAKKMAEDQATVHYT